MEEQEVRLMKGNEAIAHAAVRCGTDGYFGYPITPQSEIIETLAQLKPWETTGMVFYKQKVKWLLLICFTVAEEQERK